MAPQNKTDMFGSFVLYCWLRWLGKELNHFHLRCSVKSQELTEKKGIKVLGFCKDVRGRRTDRGAALRRDQARHVRGGQQAIRQLQPRALPKVRLRPARFSTRLARNLASANGKPGLQHCTANVLQKMPDQPKKLAQTSKNWQEDSFKSEINANYTFISLIDFDTKFENDFFSVALLYDKISV